MRILSALVSLATILVLAGCGGGVTAVRTLPRVEPASLAPAAAAGTGTLVVYSAFVASESGPNEPGYRRFHSSYRIYAADGSTLIQSVGNRTGATGEEPAKVSLAPGDYRVKASANGYGLVAVPVTIRAGQSTVVRLDGPVGDAESG